MCNQQPRVSVIIPSYNHRPYIGQAIRSVLDQTFPDFELLVIDDASTDGSQQAISAFADPRMHFWAKEKNSGSAETINQGIRMAKGKYISILNSDDFFDPQRLELLYEDCERHGIKLAATDMYLVNSHGEIVLDNDHWWIEWFESLKEKYRSTGDIFQALLSGNFIITTSNIFILQDVFDHIGLFTDYKYVLDYDFLLRFLSFSPESMKFWFDAKLLYYRLHETNTIRKDPIAANKETQNILLQRFAEYLPRQTKMRFQSLADQVIKCFGHVEQESNLAWQERLQNVLYQKDLELEKYHGILQERDMQLQKKDVHIQ